MGSWEKTISSFLHTFRLDSIKRKILAFALLTTLIPSLTMGWQSYVNNKQSLQAKITHELGNVTSYTARELHLWLKGRFYDLRVFSSSYEVSENLEKIVSARPASKKGSKPVRRLKDYLRSVKEKFVYYEELMVVHPEAGVVATSADTVSPGKIRPQWLEQANRERIVLGKPYWDKALKKAVMIVIGPINSVQSRFLGFFAAKLNFHVIDQLLKNFSLGKTGQVYLINREGAMITSSRPISSGFMKTHLDPEALRTLLRNESVSLEYTDYLGEKVVGTLKSVPLLGWAIVAEISRKEAFSRILKIRDLTLLMVTGLLLGIGLIAYLLGLTIVRPLDRLTKGASKVADGNLDVNLPVIGRGEVGYMTEVFNYMVASLRQGRKELAAINRKLREKNKELKELSITDGLTGLYNRKHLMETLGREVIKAQRHEQRFSVLMIDIDHFKKYNDTYGHLAGDDVLSSMASIFHEIIRGMDFAARYGGEEFLVMLPETALDGAMDVAERIRARVAKEIFISNGKKVSVSVSIGVAEFPTDGDALESVINRADTALYKAKRHGRDQVVRAARKQARGKSGGAGRARSRVINQADS